MKFIIKDKMKGRLRVHMCQNHMSYEEADILLYYLESFEPVSSAKVYDRTADAVICYTGNPDIIIDRLRRFHYEDVKALRLRRPPRPRNIFAGRRKTV